MTFKTSADESSVHTTYAALARASFGQELADIRLVKDKVETVVGVVDGRAVSGGMSFMADQQVAGRPVRVGVLGGGCVLPEVRGSDVASTSFANRVSRVRAAGAVAAIVWSDAAKLGRDNGWATPTTVLTAQVSTSALTQAFGRGSRIDAQLAPFEAGSAVRDRAFLGWNGPLSPPDWWGEFQSAKHDTACYIFSSACGSVREPTGILSLSFAPSGSGRVSLLVHEFWSLHVDTTAAMFAFLGGYGPRIEQVNFQASCALPLQFLHGRMDRSSSIRLSSRSGWLYALLDPKEAVATRGWSPETYIDTTIGVRADRSASEATYRLLVSGGVGLLEPSSKSARVDLTRADFANWFLGGIRTLNDAVETGISGAAGDLTSLAGVTNERSALLNLFF